MAIFRAGKRIGNMDIRVGLPRDRTLDNVEGDKRLDRQPGMNPETSIGRFCLLYTSKRQRDKRQSRMQSSS